MTFASVPELQARLDWQLTSGEQAVALGALEDLTEWAVHYGKASWTIVTVPSMVKRLILGAAARYMRNPEGYDTSRAGDETLTWQRTKDAGSATFLATEIRAIEKMSNPHRASIHSAPVLAYDSAPALWRGKQYVGTEGYVPSAGGGDPFPLFTSDNGPW